MINEMTDRLFVNKVKKGFNVTDRKHPLTGQPVKEAP